MASIFVQDPVYISVQDVKDSTSKTWLAALTDNQIKSLIYKAQLAIDSYIGDSPRYPVYADWQTWLFPIAVDDVSTIPQDIKIATLYTVEQLYVNGDTITVEQAIKAETTWPHSVAYAEFGYKYIPNEALAILNRYRTISFGNVI